MCIGIVKVAGVNPPNEKILYNCFVNNPHGAGFVIHRNKENILRKGFMTFDQFINEYNKINPKQSQQMLIHFRVASVGKISKQNCHPFLISDNYTELKKISITDKKSFAIHNGTFKAFKKIKHDSKYSDTIQFIKMLSNVLNNLDFFKLNQYDESINSLINLYVNDNNSRFAVIDSYGNIFKYGDWIKDEQTNLYFTNKSYLKITDRFLLSEKQLF